jgi:hypothetical protein
VFLCSWNNGVIRIQRLFGKTPFSGSFDNNCDIRAFVCWEKYKLDLLMTTKGKIKQSDLSLRMYLDHKEYVKIFRTICGKEDNLSGFLLDISNEFLLLQLEGRDFMLNGYAVIKKDDYDSIRCGKYEKTTKRILKAEGILNASYSITTNIDLQSWTAILLDLKKNDYHIIIENINKDYLDFFIGPIKRVTKDSVSIQNYDPAGVLDIKPTSIKLNTIKNIKFGDRYSTIFRKYLKVPKSSK